MADRPLKKEEAILGAQVQYTRDDVQCMATIVGIKETGEYNYLVRLEDGQIADAKLTALQVIIDDKIQEGDNVPQSRIPGLPIVPTPKATSPEQAKQEANLDKSIIDWFASLQKLIEEKRNSCG